MPQDHDSGSRAAHFGKENATQIAQTIGAILIDPKKSNLASHTGRRVALKSARLGNNFIGVPYTLLKQVSAIIAAFEEEGKKFIILELSVGLFLKNEKPQRHGNVGQVPKRVFFAYGQELGSFTLKE